MLALGGLVRKSAPYGVASQGATDAREHVLLDTALLVPDTLGGEPF